MSFAFKYCETNILWGRGGGKEGEILFGRKLGEPAACVIEQVAYRFVLKNETLKLED